MAPGISEKIQTSPLATSAVTSGASGAGSEPVTGAALANGSNVAAWIVGTTLETSAFTSANTTVQPSASYTPGPNPQHVIAADFNGDGIADLAVSNYGNEDTNAGGNVAIFFGKGDGTFTAGPTTNAATPVAMYAADFNRDGKMDLAYADVNDAQIVVLLGNGNGTFQAPVPYTLPPAFFPESIVSADFRGIGKLDLAVAVDGSVGGPGSVAILLGNGDGTFQAAKNYGRWGGAASYLVWTDLNGDGKLDLIVANPNANAISFLFGNGDGSFQPQVEYATGADSGYFASFPGTSGSAIVTADGVAGALLATPVSSNGIAGAPPMYQLGNWVTGVAAADLNGDGYPDIIAADGGISVQLRIPNAEFSDPTDNALQSGSQAVSVAVGDINGDGKNDVVAASEFTDQSGGVGGTLDVAFGNGNGTLGTQASYALGGDPGGSEGAVPSGVVIADFSGDGKMDVAAGYQTSAGQTADGGLSVFINNGQGTLKPAVNYPLANFSVLCTVTGVFTSSGHNDLAACAAPSVLFGQTSTPGMAFFKGNGDGTFQNATVTPLGSSGGFPEAIAVGDVNGDGKLDLVATVLALVQDNQVITEIVLLGNGDGTFRQLAPVSTPASGSALALVDLNGDGILDLVVGDNGDSGESVYLLGNGDGTFQSPIYFSSGAEVTGFAVTSWNKDGVAGLAIAHQGPQPGTVEAMESTLNPKLYSSAPTLSITKSHSGNFAPGQQGATYTITVSNAANAAPVAGIVTVTDDIPPGLSLVSMTGNNWTCSANTCTRNDALAGGFTYDAITVTVNVSATASSPQVNMATVSGGGSALASASDSTIIGTGPSCTYSLTPPPLMPDVDSGAGSGSVTVTTAAGCSWTASSNASWLAITSGSSGTGSGTVNYSVAANTGTTQRTGTITIAGIAFPVTQLPPPLLTITSSHTGNFFQGETGATYSILVSNTSGASPASGTLTVTETLPSGLTLVSMSGSAWTCSGNTCTTTGTLLGGTSYPAITATVNVAANAPAQVTNQVSVSGGGSPSASGSDVTNIVAATCSFTLSSTSASLTQIGTASAGGFLPETPVTVTITPAAGATCGASYTAAPSAPWLIATTSGARFTYTALTNPHPESRSGTFTISNADGGSATFTVSELGDPEPLLNRQVRALYESVLGRDPDSGGFTFWTGVGSAGLGQMLDSFLTSPENFNSDFAVMATYQAATGSAPSYEEFIPAVASVRAGMSITALFNSLTPAGYSVQNLYQNLLQRAPTASEITSANQAGLAAWFETLMAYPASVAPVSAPNNEFMNTGTFATSPDHSNGLYIAMLYYVILGRDYDPSGYSFWVSVANTGGPGILFQGAAAYATRIQILGPGTAGQGFAGSPEFQGLYQ